MSIAYVNCLEGLSAELLLGAFLDAGLPAEALRKELGRLGGSGETLRVEKIETGNVRGTGVLFAGPPPFTALTALAETALRFFNFEKIYASYLPIHPAHGPDVLEALKELPLEALTAGKPKVTAEGVALLKTAGAVFGESPLHTVRQCANGVEITGSGTGLNRLQLAVGEGFPVLMIEANVDDMNPEWFDYCLQKLLEAGAADVTLVPVQMKKNRPGTLLQVVAPWRLKETVIEIILRETSTLGVRYYPVERKILERKLAVVSTPLGEIPVKIAKDEKSGIEKWVPEYEACKKIAVEKKIPLREVYESIQSRRYR